MAPSVQNALTPFSMLKKMKQVKEDYGLDLSLQSELQGEVSDKAFVTFSTFTAASIARQSMHSYDPGKMKVTHAPEPRDVIWENITMSEKVSETKRDETKRSEPATHTSTDRNSLLHFARRSNSGGAISWWRRSALL